MFFATTRPELNKSVRLWTKFISPVGAQDHLTNTAWENVQIFVATYFCGPSATANCLLFNHTHAPSHPMG